MKRRLVLAALLLLAALPACRNAREPDIAGSLVRIMDITQSPEEELACGVAVGDGSRVLTVLDYEEYTPAGGYPDSLVYNLVVVSEKHGRFEAAVEAVDPRTGATVLRVKGHTPGEWANLPPARPGDATAITQRQDVLIHGWGGPEHILTRMRAVAYPNDNAGLFFRVSEGEGRGERGEIFVGGTGSVVATPGGIVLGILGNWPWSGKILLRLGHPGMIAEAVGINSGVELLGALESNKIVLGSEWRQRLDGPSMIVIGNEERAVDYAPGALLPLSTVEGLSLAIRQIITQAGAPLAVDKLVFEKGTLLRGTETVGGGTIVIACFPRPVDIRNMPHWAGDTLATAKWVAVQFGRGDGQPNRLLYGSETYKAAGAFELGDVSELERAIPAGYQE